MRNLLLAVLLAAGITPAASIYNFSWNTAGLAAGGESYVLNAVLIGEVGNTVAFSNFVYGGGSGPNLTVTLDSNASYFSESLIVFTPGSVLNFTVTATQNGPVAPVTIPDTLSLYLLDSNLNLLESSDVFASAILTLELGPGTIVSYEAAGGLDYGMPLLQSIPPTGSNPAVPEVPEPGTLSLAAGAMALWCLSRRRG